VEGATWLDDLVAGRFEEESGARAAAALAYRRSLAHAPYLVPYLRRRITACEP
jgi:hypothetical protein